jgi:amino acid transporter
MASTRDSTALPNSAKTRAAQVVVVSSVMFTFISYWRTAAVVLCDMSSTVFYVGAIVENAIGEAAPWFVLAVLLFSFAMRSVYIESCALFVRGGVYRIVKEAMGGFFAKAAVSALLFDYVLTGPISSVSAGQYIVGLAMETVTRLAGIQIDPATREAVKSWGSVAIACAVTLYFLRQNLLGIHESSGKALRIMMATTVMGVVMFVWSLVTLAVNGPTNEFPTWQPDLSPKVEVDESGATVPKLNPITREQEDPLGWVSGAPRIAEPIRHPVNWLSLFGAMGIIIAFGHAVLGMSGQETLAQVYREIESPKLPNFKKVGLIVCTYSLLLTGTMTFLTVMMVPQHARLTEYYDNWMGGLAMQMAGPLVVRLLLNAFVVVVGFLILSGAVNTSILGSNGVLSRVAEDGVLPNWFLRPHWRFGTNYRQLYLIVGLQMIVIIASRGNVILLGEAYAFGVVWSFVFNTLSMVMLRFKKRGLREYVVPLNIHVGDVYVPIGLSLIALVMILSALANLVTKPVATIGGLCFGGVFLTVFTTTEYLHRRRLGGNRHEHLEQFNRAAVPQVTASTLELTKPYCKLIAIRSPQNLFMLDKALADTDPQITDVVVMTAKVSPRGAEFDVDDTLDMYDQQLLTAVVEHAEKLGKPVRPLLVPTNNPLHAVLKTAKDLPAQEVVVGASNKYTAEEQLDLISLYWINLHEGEPRGLTVHIISADRDLTFDLHDGNRIPTAAERRAKTAADLREAGIGVQRVLMAHDGTSASHDVFEWLITMLSSGVTLDVALAPPLESAADDDEEALVKDQQRAGQLGRSVKLLATAPQSGPEFVRLATSGDYDLIVMPWPAVQGANAWVDYVRHNAPCNVFLAAHALAPREVMATD